jgi:hypothetical protein
MQKQQGGLCLHDTRACVRQRLRLRLRRARGYVLLNRLLLVGLEPRSRAWESTQAPFSCTMHTAVCHLGYLICLCWVQHVVLGLQGLGANALMAETFAPSCMRHFITSHCSQTLQLAESTTVLHYSM